MSCAKLAVETVTEPTVTPLMYTFLLQLPDRASPRGAPGTAFALGRWMLTQGFRGLAHSVRRNLCSQWNENTIYQSTRGLISKRTTRIGTSFLEGAGSLDLTRLIE